MRVEFWAAVTRPGRWYQSQKVSEITSPLRVFSWGFRERWVSRCMRHATAKFGSLVHRFGMISVGLHAREFFEIDFWSFLDPPNRGYFEGGAGISAQI